MTTNKTGTEAAGAYAGIDTWPDARILEAIAEGQARAMTVLWWVVSAMGGIAVLLVIAPMFALPTVPWLIWPTVLLLNLMTIAVAAVTLALAPVALAQSAAACTTDQLARTEDGFIRKVVAGSDRITANAEAGGTETVFTLELMKPYRIEERELSWLTQPSC